MSPFRYASLSVLTVLFVFTTVTPASSHTSDTQCPQGAHFDAMVSLLGSDEAIEALFDSHFEYSYMHISHSSRSDRLSWMHYYRRFLPDGDLDLVLSFNISATSSSLQKPLQIHRDINVLRVVNVGGFHAWMPIAKNPYLPGIRAAVRDGAVLNLYHMSSRSRLISVFEDALRSFWSVPVSTTFVFHPTLTATQKSPAPEIFDSEIFLVTLHGVAKAHLYTDVFPFPSRHHIDSRTIRQVAHNNLTLSRTINLHEGDVLYLPRGTGIDVRTSDSMALFIRFEIQTSKRQLMDGILKAVDIATRSGDLLNSPVTAMDVQELNAPKWSNVILTAVKMAAEFTPAMRRFLPVQGETSNIVERTGQMVGIQLIQDSLMRFTHAGESALFDPVIEILVSNEESVREVASVAVVEWAKEIGKQGREQQYRAKDIFQRCIRAVSHSTSATVVFREMSMDWQNVEKCKERQKQLRLRELNLERHNQTESNRNVLRRKDNESETELIAAGVKKCKIKKWDHVTQTCGRGYVQILKNLEVTAVGRIPQSRVEYDACARGEPTKHSE